MGFIHRLFIVLYKNMSQKTKIIILIITAIIITGLAVFAVYFILKNKIIDSQQIEEQIGIEENKIEGSETHYTPDYKIMRKAAQKINIKYCDQLKEYSKDNCIYDVAVGRNSFYLCGEIRDDELKNMCQEVGLSMEAIEAGNTQKCLGLLNEDFKKQCLSEIFRKNNDINICLDFTVEYKDLCESIIYSSMAFETKNIEFCDNVKMDVYKKNCVLSVENIPKDTDGDGLSDENETSLGIDPFKEDTDGDGLSDLDEMSKYFTDPKNNDTDGDGYSDGEEVRNGYNPKGDGRLK